MALIELRLRARNKLLVDTGRHPFGPSAQTKTCAVAVVTVLHTPAYTLLLLGNVFSCLWLFAVCTDIWFSSCIFIPQLSWLRSASFHVLSSSMPLPSQLFILSRCDCTRLFALHYFASFLPFVSASPSWFCTLPPAFEWTIFLFALLGLFAFSLFCCFLWEECRYELRRFRFPAASLPSSNVLELDGNLAHCSLFLRLDQAPSVT